MHRRVNILRYVKTPIGRWQWEPIPKNRRTGSYLWSNAKSNQFYVVWREATRHYYPNPGSTPSGPPEARRRKGFELAAVPCSKRASSVRLQRR